MIVVPVGCYDQADSLRRVNADTLQVPKRARYTFFIKTRVNEHPKSVTNVQNDAFAVTGTDQCDFEFVNAGRRSYFCHSFIA